MAPCSNAKLAESLQFFLQNFVDEYAQGDNAVYTFKLVRARTSSSRIDFEFVSRIIAARDIKQAEENAGDQPRRPCRGKSGAFLTSLEPL